MTGVAKLFGLATLERRQLAACFVSVIAGTILAVGFNIETASAHPALLSSTPSAEGATTTSPTKLAPKAVVLVFSEGVIARFSGASITDEQGRRAVTGKAGVDPSDASKLSIPIVGILAPGRYVVDWHAVAQDTHRVTGRFAFIVGR